MWQPRSSVDMVNTCRDSNRSESTQIGLSQPGFKLSSSLLGPLVAYDLHHHQGTISWRRRSPFARVELSSLFIMNFLTRTCLSGSSLISLSLLGFRVGSSLFGILFMKPFSFVNLLISMSIFRLWVVGLKWALSPLSPFSAL